MIAFLAAAFTGLQQLSSKMLRLQRMRHNSDLLLKKKRVRNVQFDFT